LRDELSAFASDAVKRQKHPVDDGQPKIEASRDKVVRRFAARERHGVVSVRSRNQHAPDNSRCAKHTCVNERKESPEIGTGEVHNMEMQ
jgi:hypothetical protein